MRKENFFVIIFLVSWSEIFRRKVILNNKSLRAFSDFMSNTDNTVVITAGPSLSGHKLKNFYFTNVFQGFAWMLFHFSIVYFFTAILDNLALVGIFLGFSNFVSFLLDIPLGILQRYISTKRFFVIGVISQLIAIGILFMLISQAFSVIQSLGDTLTGDKLKAVSDWFFGSAIHWVGLLIAAFCYGLTKELNEVSTFGYILSNSSPTEYGIILSRSNITFGIGSVAGLVLSGVILSLGNVMALIFLGAIIFGLLMFTIRFFDNDRDSISMEDIKEFTISVKKLNAENIKEKLSQTINAAELQKVVTNTKYLFLKPKQKKAKNEKIPWGDIMVATKKEFGIIWEIISATPMHYGLIWGLILVLIFGFWDTFASSFLIDYLDAIKPGFGYILLAAIGIPGIVLQEVAIKLGQKIGDKNIGLVGLALSGGSLLVMGIMAIGEPPSAMSIILVALINSLGYACGMAIGQNAFLDIYNRTYADHENLKEIDANASAGPMKVIQNLANVVGLTLGGILLVAGFSVFFFIFAIVIIATLVWTIMKRKEINV